MPNTDPVLDSAPLLRSLREAAAREARIPVGFLAAITRGLEGEQLTEMAELREAGRARLHRRRQARSRAPACCARRCSTSGCAAACSRCTRRTRRSRAAARCTRAPSAPRSASPGIPTIAESTMVARDAALAGYEDGARALPAPQLRRLGRGRRRGQGARLRASAPRSRPHHLLLTEEDVRGAGHAHEDAPAARPSEADRRALIEGLRDGTIDCVATDHAPHARDEKEVPFEQAPMGTTGLETAFAALYTGLVLPGVLELGAARRADDRRRRAVRAAARARSPPASPPTSTLVDLDARVGRRRARLGEPLGELLLRRARACRAACC